MWFRHMVSIERFRITFVEVYDYRIFFVWVEVLRFIDNSFQRCSVQRNPGDEFGSSPIQICLLFFAVGKLDGLFETKVRKPYIRILLKCFRGIDHCIRIFRFDRCFQHEVSGQQGFRRFGGREMGTVISGTFCLFIEHL